MSHKITILLLPLLILACETPEKTSFHYEDLSAFQKTINSLAAESDSLKIFSNYLQTSSPGLKGWANRYRVSADLFNQRYPDYEFIYNELPKLEKPLRQKEEHIRNSIEKLGEMAEIDIYIPVYYFVSNQHTMAGTPILADSIISAGVAVGIEPEGDSLSNLNATANSLSQLAIHEAAHIFQIYAQGGSEEYRTIYDPEKGSMMAVAIREGCAEYVTFLASGDLFGDRYIFVEEHEEELWQAFKIIAFEPPFSVPGWFSGSNEAHPEWPFQVGYSLGFKMCEAYHLAADNPNKRLSELLSLYNEEHTRQVWEAYDAKF